MGKTYLGIEMGNQNIKFAVCTEDKIKQLIVEQLPDNAVRDGRVVSWDAMREFIKQKIKEHRILCKEVALVLPEDATYVRRFLMPYMTTEQMKINLPYEFRDFITEEKDKYIYDYAVMDIVEETHDERVSKNIDIMAVAALKETIEHYKDMLKHCKLKLKIAAPKSCAYQNLIRKYISSQPEQEAGDYAILDIGHQTVNLKIFTGGKYETGKEMETGLKEVTYAISSALSVDEHIAEIYKMNNQNNVLYSEACRMIYDQIALEVHRVINFFTYNYPNNVLDTLYVCGGGAKIEPLMKSLNTILDVNVKGLDVLFKDIVDDEKAMLLGATAVGITWN